MSAEPLILYTCATHIFKPPAGAFPGRPAVYFTSQPRMDAEIGLSFLNLHGGFLLCYSSPLTPRGQLLLH